MYIKITTSLPFLMTFFCMLANCLFLLGCVNTHHTIGCWFSKTQLRFGTRTERCFTLILISRINRSTLENGETLHLGDVSITRATTTGRQNYTFIWIFGKRSLTNNQVWPISKCIRQWPINWCTSPMIYTKLPLL